jgi:hypothetical protein
MAKFSYDDFKKKLRANLQPIQPQANKFNSLLQRAKAKIR